MDLAAPLAENEDLHAAPLENQGHVHLAALLENQGHVHLRACQISPIYDLSADLVTGGRFRQVFQLGSDILFEVVRQSVGLIHVRTLDSVRVAQLHSLLSFPAVTSL